MVFYHDKRRPAKQVREPVQINLDPADQGRLERLRNQLNSSKSDVLRRGLAALERALTDPDQHPALRIIGIADGAAETGDPGFDLGREHDRFLSDAEEESWDRPGNRGRRGR